MTINHLPFQQRYHQQEILESASIELESMRCWTEGCAHVGQKTTSNSSNNVRDGIEQEFEFPPNCLKLLYSLQGNSHCVDCGTIGPEWASVTYGCLICVNCSGRHRSYGVQTSFVRSIRMDKWTHKQVLAMLEGGNEQLGRFFDRHKMSCLSNNSMDSTNMRKKRYLTKAAQFYRFNFLNHVQYVSNTGIYKGREAARRMMIGNNNNNDAKPNRPRDDDENSEYKNNQQEILKKTKRIANNIHIPQNHHDHHHNQNIPPSSSNNRLLFVEQRRRIQCHI